MKFPKSKTTIKASVSYPAGPYFNNLRHMQERVKCVDHLQGGVLKPDSVRAGYGGCSKDVLKYSHLEEGQRWK